MKLLALVPIWALFGVNSCDMWRHVAEYSKREDCEAAARVFNEAQRSTPPIHYICVPWSREENGKDSSSDTEGSGQETYQHRLVRATEEQE